MWLSLLLEKVCVQCKVQPHWQSWSTTERLVRSGTELEVWIVVRALPSFGKLADYLLLGNGLPAVTWKGCGEKDRLRRINYVGDTWALDSPAQSQCSVQVTVIYYCYCLAACSLVESTTYTVRGPCI